MSIMLDEQAAGQIRTILRLVKNVIDRSNMTRHDDSAHKCLSFLLTCCETTREKTFSRQVMAYTCLAFHNRFEDAVATMLMPRRRLPKTLRSTSPEEKMRKLLASLKKYVDDGPCKSIKQIVF
jgi:predicted nucleotidyltransferase